MTENLYLCLCRWLKIELLDFVSNIFKRPEYLPVLWHSRGLMDRFETERTNVPGYHYHNDRRRLMTMMTTCTVIRINHLPRLGLRLSVTEANGWAAANQSETLHHYLTWYRGTCLYGCLLVCCSCCQSFHVNTFRTVKPKAKLQSPVPTKPQVPT